jgi:hypothetical protein
VHVNHTQITVLHCYEVHLATGVQTTVLLSLPVWMTCEVSHFQPAAAVVGTNILRMVSVAQTCCNKEPLSWLTAHCLPHLCTMR